jgi:RNA-directed DNA polymerase
MITYQNLYHKIWEFDNLLMALKKAQKGKREVKAVARFLFQQEKNLFWLQRVLKNKTYQPGKYKTFYIYDPKERMISAAPFHDRVVHHALCNIIEPLFDKTFIYDSYANRKGKGTHKAILRYQQYARKYPYVLKCDIRKFFPSIDHEILKEELRWKIQCEDTLWLIDKVIDGSNKQKPHDVYFPGDDLFTPFQRKKGLPIGNLTSQFWANVYMNRFDHFVKEELGVKGYIRYVDDFVVFGKNKGAVEGVAGRH